MTQYVKKLQELTHRLFDGEISAEEYRRAVASYPHPHGALPGQSRYAIDEITMSRCKVRLPSNLKPVIVLSHPIIGNSRIRDLFSKAHVKSRFKMTKEGGK